MTGEPEKQCALDLDALRFDELGRSPVTGSEQVRIDPASFYVPEPRSRRSGCSLDRELHRADFSSKS